MRVNCSPTAYMEIYKSEVIKAYLRLQRKIVNILLMSVGENHQLGITYVLK